MHSSTRRRNLSIRDITVFAVLGTLMYISHAVMQGLPNIHLIAVFLGAITLVYRVRALIPLYVYVMLYGIFSGFSFWWIPYLYIWLPLWGAFMLAGRLPLPKINPRGAVSEESSAVSSKTGALVTIGIYMFICALHGLLFGIMYSPMQALFFGLSFEGMVTWIIAGLWYDVIHAVSNLVLAMLIVPLAELLRRLK